MLCIQDVTASSRNEHGRAEWWRKRIDGVKNKYEISDMFHSNNALSG